MVERSSFDVLVVGAGPAGIAAASMAAECGRRVAVVDDNPAPGGQIWRGAESGRAARWLQRLDRAGAVLISETSVIAQAERGVLLAESADKVRELAYDKLVLATGARERFLPFPGWTLPNVVGAGGLQALVKGGLPIAGKRVVVAGTGPLLLAVAAYLRKRGAIVPLIAEQASKNSLIAFGLYLGASPGKLAQAIRLKGRLLSTRYATGCWPVSAEGEEQLESVTYATAGIHGVNRATTWRAASDSCPTLNLRSF